MIRASRLPLSLLIGIITLVAVMVFSAGLSVEAQDDRQRQDDQLQVEQNNRPQQDQQQDQEQRPAQQQQEEQQNQEQRDQEARPEQQQQQEEERPRQQEEEQPAQQPQQQQQEEDQASGNVYTYVAQPGDSYTLMARKAVQTYGIIQDVNLSQAGIVYAETQLVKQAGEPELEVGQQVQFQESEVARAVRQAQELSDAEESMWDFYAQQVPSFNTDNVGEGSVQGAAIERDDQEEGRDQETSKDGQGQTKGAKSAAGQDGK